MKYTVNLDENNYVLSIANTLNDNIELDLTDIDLPHLSAYQRILFFKLDIMQVQIRQFLIEKLSLLNFN